MSKFGEGFAYCVGLFLAHAESKVMAYKGEEDYSMWFNAAADHLFELVIPDCFDEEARGKINAWQELCLNFRLDQSCTKKDFVDALDFAKNILLKYDQLLGVVAEKAEYE